MLSFPFTRRSLWREGAAVQCVFLSRDEENPTSRATDWACGKSEPARRALFGRYLLANLRVGSSGAARTSGSDERRSRSRSDVPRTWGVRGDSLRSQFPKTQDDAGSTGPVRLPQLKRCSLMRVKSSGRWIWLLNVSNCSSSWSRWNPLI